MEEELKLLIGKLKQAGVDTTVFQKAFENTNRTVGETEKLLTAVSAEIRKINAEAVGLNSSFSEMRGNLAANLAEIAKSNKAINSGSKAYRGLVSQVERLSNEEAGIAKLSQKELDTIRAKTAASLESLKAAGDRLAIEQDLSTFSGVQLGRLIESRLEAGKLTEQEAALLRARQSGYQTEKEALGLIDTRIAKEKAVTSAIGLSGDALNGMNTVLKSLGISGLQSQFEELTEEIRTEQRKEIEEQIKLWEDEGATLDEINEKLKNFTPTINATSQAAKGLGGIFVKALTDPAAILTAIVNGFFDVNKASTKLQQLTGQNSTALAGLNSELASSVQVLEVMAELTAQTGRNAQNIFSGDNLAQAAAIQNTLGLAASEAGNLAIMAQTSGTSIEDVNRSIVDTTSNFNKSNKSAVSQGQILRDVANTSDDIKLSLGGNPAAIAKAASAARKLGMDLSRVDQIADSLLDFESSIEAELEAQLLTGKNINMAKARELALNNDLAGLGKELFNNSADIHEFGKMNRIQQEAQAKALGMSRQELAKIAYNRALDNDMTKEQAAAAANVKLEDMERLAVQEKLALAATKLAQAFSPMLDILIPIVDALVMILAPIANGIALVMDFGKAISDGITMEITAADNVVQAFGKTVFNVLAAIPKLIAGLGILALGNSIKNFVSGKGLKFDLFKKLKTQFSKVTGLANKAKEKVGEVTTDTAKGATDKATTTAKDKAGKVVSDTTKTSDLSKNAEPKTSGQGIREFLTNLAEGLKAMGSTKVLGGALNLIPASIGFVAFIPGYFGAKLMERLDGEAVKESLTGLAEGLGVFGTGRVTLGAVNLIAASAGFVATLLGIPGMLAIGPAGQVAARGIQALVAPLITFAATTAGIKSLALLAGTGILLIPGSIGLAMFAGAAALVGPAITALNPALIALGTTMMTGVGAIGLAALAAAALALGASLGMAGPGIEAFGSVLANFAPIIDAIGKVVLGVFQSIPDIIQAAADGFVTMFDAIAGADVGKLFLLGPALISAAAGIAVFSAVLAASSMVTGLSSLLTGGGVLGDLKELAAIAAPMSTLGTSLVNVAAGIAAIATALSTLETEKLGELKDLVITTAFAAPAIAATGAITEMISGLTGGGSEDSSNQELLAEIKLLRAAVEAGGDVYIDGNKAGQSLMMASSKLS